MGAMEKRWAAKAVAGVTGGIAYVFSSKWKRGATIAYSFHLNSTPEALRLRRVDH